MRKNAVFIPLSALRFSGKPGGGVCEHRIRELRIQIENGEDIEPIRVNALGDGTYTIKDGRHRVRAHIAAGFSEIAAFVENLSSTIKKLLRSIFRFFQNPSLLGLFYLWT